MDEPDDAPHYPCPCCGYLTFDEPPGSFDICPICFWEDDSSQLRFPGRPGANAPLLEAQQTFQRYGMAEGRMLPYVRPAAADDARDPEWRPIDPERDDFEVPLPGVDNGATYPNDLTRLYYWRPTFWRRGGRPSGGPPGEAR